METCENGKKERKKERKGGKKKKKKERKKEKKNPEQSRSVLGRFYCVCIYIYILNLTEGKWYINDLWKCHVLSADLCVTLVLSSGCSTVLVV